MEEGRPDQLTQRALAGRVGSMLVGSMGRAPGNPLPILFFLHLTPRSQCQSDSPCPVPEAEVACGVGRISLPVCSTLAGAETMGQLCQQFLPVITQLTCQPCALGQRSWHQVSGGSRESLLAFSYPRLWPR
jgi:hypothetical protein